MDSFLYSFITSNKSRICTNPTIVQVSQGDDRKPLYVKSPCGKCPSCLVRKAESRSKSIRAVSSFFKYTYFVTLTYKPRYMPCFSVDHEWNRRVLNDYERFLMSHNQSDPSAEAVKQSDKLLFKFNIRPRFGVEGLADIKPESIYEFDSADNYKQFLVSAHQKSHPGLYCFPHWPDVVLFMKRFRRHLKDYTNEKVSVCIVSEYGTRRLRGHIHILFFFNSDRLSENLRRYISSLWPFGRARIELSRGNAENYVADYLNSFYVLPRFILRNSLFKPRFTRSNFFEKPINDIVEKTICENPESAFIDPVRFRFSSYVLKLFPRWKSFPSRYSKSSADRFVSPLQFSSFVRSLVHCEPEILRESCSVLSVARRLSAQFLSGTLDNYHYLELYECLGFSDFDIRFSMISRVRAEKFTDRLYRILMPIHKFFVNCKRSLKDLYARAKDSFDFIRDLEFRQLKAFYRECSLYKNAEIVEFLRAKFFMVSSSSESLEFSLSPLLVNVLNSRDYSCLQEKIKHREVIDYSFSCDYGN